MKGGCRMDKDMERLGKERLKRVRRRRQLATFVVSMAVIVLSITMYRLIQTASAEDQKNSHDLIDDIKAFAKELNTIIIVTGPVDYVTDGNKLIFKNCNQMAHIPKCPVRASQQTGTARSSSLRFS